MSRSTRLSCTAMCCIQRRSIRWSTLQLDATLRLCRTLCTYMQVTIFHTNCHSSGKMLMLWSIKRKNYTKKMWKTSQASVKKWKSFSLFTFMHFHVSFIALELISLSLPEFERKSRKNFSTISTNFFIVSLNDESGLTEGFRVEM